MATLTTSPTAPKNSSSSSSSKLSFTNIGLSAALASLITKSILHPIDTVKCRVQAVPHTTWREFFVATRGQWTPPQVYRGLGVKLVAYAPISSIYMVSYHGTKEHLEGFAQRHGYGNVPAFAVIIPACLVADCAAAFVRVPMEAVKMRLQANVYSGAVEGVKHVRRDGLRHLTRLFVPQVLLHDVPFSIVQWGFYETLRPFARRWVSWATGKDASGPVASLISGALAGSVTGFVTTPFDIVKTRVVVTSSVSRCGSSTSVPAWSAATSSTVVARAIYREKGLAGFMRSSGIRVCWMATNAGLYFSVFEAMKIYGPLANK
jgi:hypothetical protein